MREIGPPRYAKDDVIGRWRVVRRSSPVQRAHGNGRLVLRHRVLVECICGTQRIVLERTLMKGESTGCRSKVCQAWHVLREEERDLRRLVAEAADEAIDARARIDDVTRKIARTKSRLPFVSF